MAFAEAPGRSSWGCPTTVAGPTPNPLARSSALSLVVRSLRAGGVRRLTVPGSGVKHASVGGTWADCRSDAPATALEHRERSDPVGHDLLRLAVEGYEIGHPTLH